MSKALAKTLSLQTTALIPIINEANQEVVQPNKELPLENRVSEFDNQRRTLLNLQTKIEQRVHSIEEHHGRWLTFLETAKNQEKENEFYDEVTSQTENFLLVSMEAKNTITNLSSHIQWIEDVVARLSPRENTPQIPQLQGTTNNTHDFQLPTLKLKTFTGDLQEWPAFKAAFEAAIGNNSKIAPISKLNYFFNSLEGKAAHTVTGYALVPENYEVVRKALEERFGSNDAITNALYDRLEKVEKADRDIRATVDSLECILRQLEAQGEDLESRQMHRLIEQKLPHWAILQVIDRKTVTATVSHPFLKLRCEMSTAEYSMGCQEPTILSRHGTGPSRTQFHPTVYKLMEALRLEQDHHERLFSAQYHFHVVLC